MRRKKGADEPIEESDILRLKPNEKPDPDIVEDGTQEIKNLRVGGLAATRERPVMTMHMIRG